MFHKFFAAVALLSLCVPSVFAVPTGFPIEALPANVSDSSLKLPINPAVDHRVSWDIHYETSDSPKLSELMTAVVVRTYKYWKDPSTSGIGRRTQERVQPFRDFLHTVEPTTLGRTLLTPLKVGITYCVIMKGILQPQTPPGKVTIGVSDSQAQQSLGTVSVINSPPHAVEKSTLYQPLVDNSTIRLVSILNTGTSGQLSMPQNTLTREKAWLDSLRNVAVEIFSHGYQELVVGTTRSIRPGVTTHYDNDFDPDIQANVTLVAGRAANVITWDQMALAMQTLYIAAAAFDNFEVTRFAAIGTSGDAPIASISVGRKWNPANVGVADDGAPTA